MHEPPESPAFASKQATAEYLRDTILKALDKDVEKSRLSIGVHDSPKTNSKYINLYYPDRADNPDPDRVPFTVRISDHFDQQYLFRRNRPNVCLHVVPLLTTREKSLRGISIKVYEGLSMSLQGSLAADVRLELRRLRAKLAEQLDREQKNFQYTFSGDLQGAITRMRSLLGGTPLVMSRRGDARWGTTDRDGTPLVMPDRGGTPLRATQGPIKPYRPEIDPRIPIKFYL